VQRFSRSNVVFERRDIDRLIDVKEYFITIVLQSAPRQSRTEGLAKITQAVWRLKPDEPYAIFVFPNGEVCL
jgi:hypothetical protein